MKTIDDINFMLGIDAAPFLNSIIDIQFTMAKLHLAIQIDAMAGYQRYVISKKISALMWKYYFQDLHAGVVCMPPTQYGEPTWTQLIEMAKVNTYIHPFFKQLKK